jgi:chorismate lyase/3-hydroxybenzoate synthase
VARDVESPGITSAQRIPASNTFALHTGYVETARLEALLKATPSNFLGIVRHDRNSKEPSGVGACPVVCLDMPQLNGPPLAEVWMSSLPVAYHQTEGFQCATNDEVLFGALQLEESPGMLLDTVTYNAYRHLLVQVRALGYPHLLRVWNYFSHINRESHGLERYKRFCVGRYQALTEDL